jgi:hypothetical protein
VARLVAYVASAVKNKQGERFGRRVGFPYLVTTYRAGFCRHCHLCCAGRPHTFLIINTASSSTSCRKPTHALAIQKPACVLRYVDGYIALSWQLRKTFITEGNAFQRLHVAVHDTNSGVPRGVVRGFKPPPPKFRSFDNAKPNSQFRGKYIRNCLLFLFHHPN